MQIEKYKIAMREKVRNYYSQGVSVRMIGHKFAIEKSLVKYICKDVIIIQPKKKHREIIYL